MKSSKAVPMPKNNWSFDESVTEKFESHVRDSVPNYEQFHKLVTDIAEFFVENDSNVYDIGASTGEAIGNLCDKFSKIRKNVQYIGVDESSSMCFAMEDKNRHIKTENVDVTSEEFSMKNASFVTAILTLQFIQPKKRQALVQKIYDALNPGGCFVMIEKVLSADPRIDEMYTEMYHDFKLSSGLSKEDIFDKTRSIRGVMRPNTAEENVSMLRNAGFQNIDAFYRWCNFCGIIAIKGV